MKKCENCKGFNCCLFPEEIKPYDRSYFLSEIGQSVPTQFSFVDKEGIQVTPPFVCRDFAHDALRTMHTGVKSAIYGFEYDLAIDKPLDLKNTRMLILRTNDVDIMHSIELLHHYEDMRKIQLTKVKAYTLDEVDYWYFISDKFWQTTSFHISLYTLLIRLGQKQFRFTNDKELHEAYDKIESLNDNDSKYLKLVKKIINKFIMYNDFENLYLKYKDLRIGAYHDLGGIYSLAKGITYDKEVNSIFGK